jgi:ribosomal 30S subunit maturation factor RimM
LKTIELGFVTRPHGVRGELKVKLHFEQSNALFEVPHVLLAQKH